MRFYLNLSLLIVLIPNCYSQTQANVQTPKGNPVTAFISSENSDYWRNYYDSYFTTTNRTYLYYFSGEQSSSRRFNCHGYAWNMVEGGPVRWIGYYVTTDEDIYMSDGSYVQVCSEMYPGKVSWGSGDHTAITTATPGRWISKWNEYPLVEHNWDDTPYGTTNLKYYVSTKISGSIEPLCSGTRNYNVENISGASYTWYVSGALQIQSGQGTSQISVQGNGNGLGTIYVEISTACTTTPAISPSVNVWVGSPFDFLITGPTLVTASSYNDYSIVLWNQQTPSFAMQGVNLNQATWSFPWTATNGGWSCGGCMGQTVGVQAGNLSTIVRAEIQNACDTTGRNYEVFVQQENCPPGGCEEPFFVYPNPSSEELTISTNLTDNGTLSEVTLVDSQGTVVYNSKSKGQVKIPVREFKNGLYYLKVNQNGVTKQRQIIINH